GAALLFLVAAGFVVPAAGGHGKSDDADEGQDADHDQRDDLAAPALHLIDELLARHAVAGPLIAKRGHALGAAGLEAELLAIAAGERAVVLVAILHRHAVRVRGGFLVALGRGGRVDLAFL